MRWRFAFIVWCGALGMAWWSVGARAEPMPLGLAPPTVEPALPVSGAPSVEPPAASSPAKPDEAAQPVSFPYRAAITSDTAAVRSGPGDEYYQTSGLRRGDEVEVYRHDPHGWCAIRPPPGSFSYVPAEHLKLLEDDVAETTVAGVKSFVGSSVGDGRDRSHVSLRRGERVMLLEKKPAEGLCKIAPPAGEFRWVPEKSLERLGPVADAGSPTAAAADQRGAATSSSETWRAAPRTTAFHEPDDKNNAQGSDSLRGDAPDGTGQRFAAGESHAPAKAKPRRPMLPQRGWVRPSSATTEEDEPDDESPPAASAPSSAVFPRSEGSAPAAPRGDDRLMSDALDQMDLALSNMVCQPKNQWNLDPLRDAAKDVLRNADSPAEQGRARRLLDRLAQFETVRRQALGLPPAVIEDRPATVMATTAPPRPRADQHMEAAAAAGHSAASPTSESAPANSPLPPNWEDPRFDGTGRLMPLEKRGDGDPQFVLVDDQGVARYYVTPAPGVNLRGYRQHLVGITGSRMEDPEGGKPRLTAQRVTLLPDAPPRR